MTNEEINQPVLADLPMAAQDEMPAPVEGQFSNRRRSQAILRENLLLVLLFAAGILGVYILSLRGGPVKASAEQIQTEQEVESAMLTMNRPTVADKDVQSILDAFYTQARQRQIGMDKLKGNPFVFKSQAPIIPATPTTKPIEVATPQQINNDRNEALTAVKQLSLQSVLTGGNGRLATISNNLLTEGQTISGWTVSKINPGEVVLTWRDQTYVLKMGQ